MTAVNYIAIAYACMCLGVIGFQIALIVGAPWGCITQGGQVSGPLPTRGRVLAALSIVLLIAMALSILSAAGLWPSWPIWASWTALGMQLISCVLNWITPSKPERVLWGPITSTMLFIATVVVVV